MSDYQLTTEDLERFTVQVYDSRYRTLAVVSALEDRFLSEHAPWRALYAEHETTYSADVPSAHHYRAHLVEELRPRLQDRLYTYTPSTLELRLQPLYGALHRTWSNIRFTALRLRHPRTNYGPTWKQLQRNSEKYYTEHPSQN
jgi:hypothetical protein